MSYYFIARVDIHDEAEYAEYRARLDEVFPRFNGKYLAVDTAPEALEGNPGPGRIVLIEFPSREELLRWYHSPEYQEVLKLRLRSARSEVQIIRGLE